MTYIIPHSAFAADRGEIGVEMQKKKPSTAVYVEAEEAGIGYVAKFAYPGMTNEYVATNEGRIVFTEEDARNLTAKDAAELAAYRALAKRWNRHIPAAVRAKNYHGMKPFPWEVKAALDAAWPLDSISYAHIRLTTPQKVEAWVAGTEDAPTQVLWELHLLSKPGAIEEAVAIINPMLKERAALTKFKQAIDDYDKVFPVVKQRVDEERQLADLWERENFGQKHRYRPLIEAFDKVADRSSDLSMRQRRDMLESIAGRLGMNFDYNEEVMRQNQPRYEAAKRKRYEQSAKERVIKKDIEKSRADRIREEREIAAHKAERENRMIRLGLKKK